MLRVFGFRTHMSCDIIRCRCWQMSACASLPKLQTLTPRAKHAGMQGVATSSRHRGQTVIGVSSFKDPISMFSSNCQPTNPVKDSLTDARLEVEVVSLDLDNFHAVSEIRRQV